MSVIRWTCSGSLSAVGLLRAGLIGQRVQNGNVRHHLKRRCTVTSQIGCKDPMSGLCLKDFLRAIRFVVDANNELRPTV